MPYAQSNFRLGPESLADLDAIARALTERTGNPHSRADVVRYLARQAARTLDETGTLDFAATAAPKNNSRKSEKYG